MTISQVEAELALNTLLDKLEKWLVTQEEWVLLMGIPERATRRRVADLIAKELVTIPVARFETPVVNREMRRRIFAELKKDDAWKRSVT